jgi:hypothetical protein
VAFQSVTASILREADQFIRSLVDGRHFHLYRYLHATAAKFAKVDSFYVGLIYDEKYMIFPYTFDGKEIESPDWVEFSSDGITAFVMKNHRAYWTGLCQVVSVNSLGFFRFAVFVAHLHSSPGRCEAPCIAASGQTTIRHFPRPLLRREKERALERCPPACWPSAARSSSVRFTKRGRDGPTQRCALNAGLESQITLARLPVFADLHQDRRD